MLRLPSADQRFFVPLGLLLGGSLLAAIRLPYLGVGLSNAAIAVAGAALLGLHGRELVQHRARAVPLLLALIGTWGWAAVSGFTGPMPAVGLRSCVKGLIYGLALLGALSLFVSPQRLRPAARGVLGFLLILALFGVLEAAFPESAPFLLLRSEDSLSITPRVASLLPWPNQFGVAMVLALVLIELLTPRVAGRWWLSWAARLLVLIQIAQSGSRNSWLLLVATLLLLTLGRTTPWRRGLVLATVFAAVLVTLPVPARQLGLRSGSWLPAANQLIDEPQGWSPALAPANLSLNLRSKLWLEAKGEIERHPLTGLGPNVFQAYAGPRVMNELGFNTHNLLLELWVMLGTTGLVWAALLLGIAWWRRPAGVATAAGLPLAALLLGQIIDCFTQDPTMVVLMTLALAAAWMTPRPHPDPGSRIPDPPPTPAGHR